MKKDPITVSITPHTILITILLILLVGTLYVLRDLVLLVLTAIVIASAIEPGVQFFMQRAHMARVVAVFSMYFLVFGFLVGAIYLFVPSVLEEAQAFLALLPQYIETIQLPGTLQQTAFIAEEAQATQGNIVDAILAVRESFADTGEGIVRLLSTIFGGVFALFLTIVLSFYFAVSQAGIDDFLRIITPRKNQDYVLSLWRRSQRKIGLWMQGQLLLSLIAGVLVYLGLMLLGVPYALLLAAFAAIAEIIPVFGSFISAVPALIVAFAAGGPTLALIVAGLFIIVNQFQSNLIYPLVVKKIVGVPPLMVILALIAGGQLAGFLGVILSVPVAATIQELVHDLQKRRGKEE